MFCIVDQKPTHIYVLYGKVKTYSYIILYTVRQDHIYKYFEGLPYSKGRSWSYMLWRCSMQLGKNTLIYTLKLFFIIEQNHIHICFQAVLYSRTRSCLYMLRKYLVQSIKNTYPIQLGKNIALNELNKTILIYVLNMFNTFKHDQIHICFQSIPYNRAKIYLYIL